MTTYAPAHTPAALLSLSALTALATALTVTPVSGFFRFELPPASALAVAIAVGLASMLWLGARSIPSLNRTERAR